MSKSLVISLIIIFLAATTVSASLLAPTETPAEAPALSVDNFPVNFDETAVRAAAINTAQAADPYGLEDTAREARLIGENESPTPLSATIGKIIFGLLGFIGVVFLVLTIAGGFLWMTAGGNSEQVKKGRDFIRNGAIGVIIILASFALTSFVFNNLIGATGGGSQQVSACNVSTNKPSGCPCTNDSQCALGLCVLVDGVPTFCS